MHRVTTQEARSRYLVCLPVRREGPLAKGGIRVDGQVQRAFDALLTNGQPDSWVGADLGAFHGRQVELWVDDATLISAPVRQADAIPGTDDLYGERYRPQFHSRAARGWLNDPNGLVAYGGTYYLFFQHDPYGNHGSGRNKHWGLATSHDLVHWCEVGDALYPDALGACWSGSAVVDWRNSSGLGDGVTPPLVCAYTSAGEPFTQSLAYSADGGSTWRPYGGNPVVPHLRAENRDPKVIWHEATERRIMALYLDGNVYALLRSQKIATLGAVPGAHAGGSRMPRFSFRRPWMAIPKRSNGCSGAPTAPTWWGVSMASGSLPYKPPRASRAAATPMPPRRGATSQQTMGGASR